MAKFDIEVARSKFPALQHDQVFFDSAGGSQTLGGVIDSIRDYLSNTNVQLGATYKTGKLSTDRYKKGQEAGAKYINAEVDEIVFGSSTTQLFRNLSFALQFSEGDEIIVSGLDHEANISPWVDLAARQKLVLKWWSPAPSPNPQLLASNLKPLLSARTRLVTCTHTSNILGTVTDVASIAAAVHTVPGALLCVDAVAYAPHRPVDVVALGVDFYAFSWYKVYGPHISMLYGRRGALARVRSLGHFFNPHTSLENKLGLAGASYELVQAVPAVVLDYLGAPGAWDAIADRERELQTVLLDYLNGRPDVTVYGETSADTALRVPTVSFRVEGWGPRDLVEAVEKDTDFGFRWGAFYSNRLVTDVLGLDSSEGVVRVSMVHYNTVEEIKSFVEALDKVLSKKV
ncbi:Uu.00g044500.m01.CDS01 [Anthostomella pinea]|uniref:Uu.00g044500.m01.CDS01 n=1 Tax=Anthostomella pinea TaxID=933095 RepID=A0AAI8VBN6_9PEZI|nr:Uu.00g044500.m01.CDS01 [Anthostomella pinea]